jgi:hypothetical protein
MDDNNLTPPKLPKAPAASKKGWETVSGQIAPEDHRRFLSLVSRWRMRRTELVAKAVRELLDREAA